MAQPGECRLLMNLALQPDHWRRHDRGFWAQTLAAAVDEAAPHMMRVDSYELRDMMVVVRARSNQAPKTMQKLLRDDESFIRLRARLFDLGARADIEIEGYA
ncbi:MAG: hypothetical protein JSS00_12870 [Proteobacteria bacterium]|nr:hypothetical protein [Pseudomonadota bacterium]